MRGSLIKFFISVIFLNKLLHALSNKNDPHPTVDNSNEVGVCVKGISFLNSFGWFIKLKTDVPLQQIELYGKWHDVKSFSDDKFSFEIFKVDLGNDHQIQEDQKLILLATPEDFKAQSNWVLSYAFIPDPLFAQGKISKSIESYNKPLIAISKVERQKNGTLLLGLGGSIEKLYQETWPVKKNKNIDWDIKNYEYKRELLKNSKYKADYLKEKKDELNQKKDDFSITQLEKEIKGDQYKMDMNQKATDPFLIIDEEMLWEDHKKELKQEQTQCLQSLAEYHSMPDSYEEADEDQKNQIKNKTYNSIGTFYHGVPDREDHGGIICVIGKNIELYNHRYVYYVKIAGFTCVKQNNKFVDGESSTAIDLTTQEVRNWISTTIDHYYFQKELANKGKLTSNNSDPIQPKRARSEKNLQ